VVALLGTAEKKNGQKSNRAGPGEPARHKTEKKRAGCNGRRKTSHRPGRSRKVAGRDGKLELLEDHGDSGATGGAVTNGDKAVAASNSDVVCVGARTTKNARRAGQVTSWGSEVDCDRRLSAEGRISGSDWEDGVPGRVAQKAGKKTLQCSGVARGQASSITL